MTKITIERETLERAIAYLEAPTAKLWPAGTLHGIAASLRAALAAQPAPAAVPLTDEQIDHTLATTLDEFARTTRGMFHALDVNADITVNSRLRRMFARAVLAAAGDNT